MSYKVKVAFKERNENFKLYKKDDVYMYDDEKRIAFLEEKGYLVAVDAEDEMLKLAEKAKKIGESIESAVSEASESLENLLNHTGGGYYELPTGEKVRGKEKALKKLKGGK